MEIFLKIINFILISFVIQLSIAAVLTIFGKGKLPDSPEGGLVFDELFLDYTNLPQLQSFTTRDRGELAYRHYPAQSDKVLVLVHGSGYHSQYFLPLASTSVPRDWRRYTPQIYVDMVHHQQDAVMWITSTNWKMIWQI
mgnify:CR=1 FL=1